MAGLDTGTGTIIAGIFAAIFWIAVAFIIYRICRQRREIREWNKRRSIRRSRRRKAAAGAGTGDDFWQSSPGDDDDYDDDDWDDDSFDSGDIYSNPATNAANLVGMKATPTAADSHASLRSDKLPLGLFNPGYSEDGPRNATTVDYDNIVVKGPTTPNRNVHRSIHNMSVRYERGKEIDNVVIWTQGQLNPPPEHAFRDSAYEDIEGQAFVPPPNRSDPYPNTSPVPAVHTGSISQGTLQPPGNLAAAAGGRGAVESVCYEMCVDQPGNEAMHADFSPPPLEVMFPPPPPPDPADIDGDFLEAVDVTVQAPQVDSDYLEAADVTAGIGQSQLSDDSFASAGVDVHISPLPTTAYENIGTQQPPPPSSPPPPAEDPQNDDPFTRAGVDVHTSTLGTTAYENIGVQQPPPLTSPPPPAEDPPVGDAIPIPTTNYENFDVHPPTGDAITLGADSRDAIVSVCYENLDDPVAPGTGGQTKAQPLTADPFDYREQTGVPSSSAGLHLSMYENPEEYSEATLRKARETRPPVDEGDGVATAVADAAAAVMTGEETLPTSVSAYQKDQEGLDAGMSDYSMRSRAVTITAGL